MSIARYSILTSLVQLKESLNSSLKCFKLKRLEGCHYPKSRHSKRKAMKLGLLSGRLEKFHYLVQLATSNVKLSLIRPDGLMTRLSRRQMFITIAQMAMESSTIDSSLPLKLHVNSLG